MQTQPHINTPSSVATRNANNENVSPIMGSTLNRLFSHDKSLKEVV